MVDEKEKLYLHIKRTKSFILPTDGGERYFTASPMLKAQPVPAWVVKTLTFKTGIADGSIVDLTPPKSTATKKSVKIESEPSVQAAYDPSTTGTNAADPAALERMRANADAALASEEQSELVGAAVFGGSKGPARPKGLQGTGGRARP